MLNTNAGKIRQMLARSSLIFTVLLMAGFVVINALSFMEGAKRLALIGHINNLNLPQFITSVDDVIWRIDATLDGVTPRGKSRPVAEDISTLHDNITALHANSMTMDGGEDMAVDFNMIFAELAITQKLIKSGLTEIGNRKKAQESINRILKHFRRIAIWASSNHQQRTANALTALEARENILRFSAGSFMILGGGAIVFLLLDLRRRDIMLARAHEAEHMKSVFFAMMSHEIRTPLNGVIGTLDLLQESPLTMPQLHLAKTARQSAESLLNIVNDVLDYSKIEAGRLGIENADYSLKTLVRSAHSIIEPLAEDKRLQLTHTIASALPDDLHGDAARVRQVLLNLLSNAVKFTEKGFIHLNVRKENPPGVDRTRAFLRFEVTDSGIGIAPAARKLLFQEFSQVEGTRTRRFAGTGLGLAICARLTELMGGTVGLSSELGKGSTFWFTVPLQEAKGKQQAAVPQNDVLSKREMHILLAEDNLTNQMVAASYLSKAGHNVTIANNGQEALDKVRQGKFDLILMDVSMPVMDGLTATKAIRALGGPFAQIPILAMTAHVAPSDREECFKAGMNSFIAKPMTRETLLSQISRWDSLSSDPYLSCIDDLGKPNINPDGSTVMAQDISIFGENVFPPAPPQEPRGEPENPPLADEIPVMASNGEINADMLKHLAEDLGREGILEFSNVFRADTVKISECMRKAAREGDWTAARRHAHSLKSAVLNFGLARLSDHAREIEEQCRNEGACDMALIAAWPERMAAAFAALDAWLAERNAEA